METRRVQSFHYPEGLAAVIDESGAYHIRETGEAAYAHRYINTFGFYQGIATVENENGFFHIDVSGNAIHGKRFSWAGNFQEGFCSVQDATGFYHIAPTGEEAYSERYDYAGDFRNSSAVVYNGSGAFHICKNGCRLYNATFDYAEPFHKGAAVVRDQNGYFHVDGDGKPLHPQYLSRAEPFYNGTAFCDDHQGRKIRLRENGLFTLVAGKLKPVSIEELKTVINAGGKVGMMVRHAERAPITPTTPNWGNDVLLTSLGLFQAKTLGSHFIGLRISGYSSPLMRCRQTAQAFTAGAGNASIDITGWDALGDPGCFFDGTFEHESEMKKDFHSFMDRYLRMGTAPGMRGFSETADEMLEMISEKTGNSQLSIFVSHDLHVACMLFFAGLKMPTRWDWCDYLEGLCVIIHQNGRIETRRLCGLKEIAS